jgi:hypothetical protein
VYREAVTARVVQTFALTDCPSREKEFDVCHPFWFDQHSRRHAYHASQKVLLDFSFLKMLSEDQVRNGMAELIKISVVGNAELFNLLEDYGVELLRTRFGHLDGSPELRSVGERLALRAVAVPERGGQTLFTNQFVAYETLPLDVRQELQRRSITHVVTGLQLGQGEETSAVHPIFRVHPISGRTFLYLSTPQRCAQVSGMSPQRAADTIAFLFDHSSRGDNVYRHAWAPDDVVMWDNRCVLSCIAPITPESSVTV